MSTAGVQHVLTWKGHSTSQNHYGQLSPNISPDMASAHPMVSLWKPPWPRDSKEHSLRLRCNVWSCKNPSFGSAFSVHTSMWYRNSVMPESHKAGGTCKVHCCSAWFPFVLCTSLFGWDSRSRSDVLHLVRVLTWGLQLAWAFSEVHITESRETDIPPPLNSLDKGRGV